MNQPCERQLTPYPGFTLTLTEVGAGPPVLLLHGAAGPASLVEIADHLAARHQVLAPTHPGWEDTPRLDWFSGVDSLVETYLDLLDDLDLGDVAVLGSSFGGWVAAELAVRDRGRRVSRLVLLNAAGPDIPGHRLQMPGGGPRPTGEAPTGPPRGNMEAMRAYAGTSFHDPKLLSRLARVRAATLVLWGEHDPILPPDFGRAYAAAIPGARFEVIRGGGHIPTREQPEATLAAIDAFLASSQTG